MEFEASLGYMQPCLKRVKVEAGEGLAGNVHKHRDLSLGTQQPCKKCHIPVIPVLGRPRQAEPWNPLASQPSIIRSPVPVRNAISKTKVKNN